MKIRDATSRCDLSDTLLGYAVWTSRPTDKTSALEALQHLSSGILWSPPFHSHLYCSVTVPGALRINQRDISCFWKLTTKSRMDTVHTSTGHVAIALTGCNVTHGRTGVLGLRLEYDIGRRHVELATHHNSSFGASPRSP